MHERIKLSLRVIGIIATLIALLFGVLLILEMFGISVIESLLGKQYALPEIIHWLAEITIGALLIAALAFL